MALRSAVDREGRRLRLGGDCSSDRWQNQARDQHEATRQRTEAGDERKPHRTSLAYPESGNAMAADEYPRQHRAPTGVACSPCCFQLHIRLPGPPDSRSLQR